MSDPLIVASSDSDFLSAFRTSFIGGYGPFSDVETMSFYEKLMALGAVRVFPWMTWNVSCVDVS